MRENLTDAGTRPVARKLIDVLLLVLPPAGLMNIFGPAEVFARANCLASKPVYKIGMVSTSAEKYDDDFDTVFSLNRIFTDWDQDIDTLLVAGSFGPQSPILDTEPESLSDWLRRNCVRARRYGAFGSGGLLLAEAGLLRQKQVAAHWSQVDEMVGRFPDIQVLPDRIYMKDGNCYTAAGGSSAIDLALLMVEEDLGAEIAQEVAKHMVLFLRRSGEQPQLSTTLLAQTSPLGSMNNLLIWMVDNLDQDLSVAALARRVAMSTRNFARTFQRQVGKTPARHVSDLRLEAARHHLAQQALSLSEVALASGFGSAEGFRRVFTKAFGLAPGRYRESLLSENFHDRGLPADNRN